jgi:glycosyltransferase involved in cell wall biosynthesis
MLRRHKTTALLPAFQAADFIQATLDALSAQTCGDFGVIVSVDACDDNTHAICLKHAARDARFKIFKQTQRLGYVGNCNFLLDQADSDYVFFAFHDDIISPDYASQLSDALDRHPDAIMSFTDVKLTAVDGTEEHWTYTQLEGVKSPVRRGELMLASAGKWWVPNRGMFRLDRARAIGGLKAHGAGEFSTDWPWLFHMSLLGDFIRVPKTLCFKFYKPGSLSRSWKFTSHQWYEVMASCMRELWNSGLGTDAKLILSNQLFNRMFRLRMMATAAERQAHVSAPSA